jgi:hypothetical protein
VLKNWKWQAPINYTIGWQQVAKLPDPDICTSGILQIKHYIYARTQAPTNYTIGWQQVAILPDPDMCTSGILQIK